MFIRWMSVVRGAASLTACIALATTCVALSVAAPVTCAAAAIAFAAALSAAVSHLDEFGFSALGDFFRESTQCQIGSFGIPLGLRGADRTMHDTDVKGV